MRDGSVEALRLLAEVSDPATFDAMIEMTTSPNPFLRRAAVSSLGYVGDPRALPAILACAAGTEDTVVHTVIEALGDLGGDEAVAAIDALAAEPEHRRRATAALDWLRTPRTVDEIIANLSDPRLVANTRTGALWVSTLAEADDLRSLEALTRLRRSLG